MKAQEFFDETAAAYDAKYQAAQSPFLHHFFTQRLEAATTGLSLDEAVVWDIGAGTGQLYRHLIRIAQNVDYHAVDVSSGMLANSPIPEDRRQVGSFPSVSAVIPDESVDAFFMLGVTTYMTDDEIRSTFAEILRTAHPEATAIITITNHSSVEFFLQRTANKVMSLPLISNLTNAKARVAGQNFKRNFMTLDHAKKLLPSGMVVKGITPLNHTFTPLNRIATRPSLALERVILTTTSEGSAVRRFLSSDLLLRVGFEK